MLAIDVGGVGGKDGIGVGWINGGSSPNDMELVDDEIPEVWRRVEVITGCCVCQAGVVWVELYGLGRLCDGGAAA